MKKGSVTLVRISVLWAAVVSSLQLYSQPSVSVTDTGWTVQKSGTGNSVAAVKAVSGDVAWAGGSAGRVVRTTDGGVTWSLTSSVSTDPIHTISAASEHVAMAGVFTTYAKIWRTTNGGVTWTVSDSIAGGFPNYIDMFNPNEAYWQGDPVGGNWELRKTTNGGATWVAQQTNTDATLYGLSFYSPSTGWAVGDDGTIEYTTNGGSTWIQPYSPTTNTLFEVQVLKTSTGGVVFATGIGGTIVCSAISPLPVRTWTGSFDSLWSSPGN